MGSASLPSFSVCPWCSDVLVAPISRGVRHSAQGNQLRMKLLPFLCQPGAHRKDDGREVVRGTNGSKLYLDSWLPETWVLGTERPGETGLAAGHFIQFQQFFNLTAVFFLNEQKQCKMLVTLCLGLQSSTPVCCALILHNTKLRCQSFLPVSLRGGLKFNSVD